MKKKTGPYSWDIDVGNMELEELEALQLIVSNMVERRRLEKCYEKKLHDLIDEAKSRGIYFNYNSPSIWISITDAQENLYASPIGVNPPILFSYKLDVKHLIFIIDFPITL